MVLDFNFNFNFLLISTFLQLKIIVLNRNNFLSTFLFFEVYCGWNFVCWINIGMIINNSFIIPWLSSLDFQVTINNKVRFMIFLLIFWTSKYLSFFRVIWYLFNFFMEFPWGLTLNQTILLVLSFSQKNFLNLYLHILFW